MLKLVSLNNNNRIELFSYLCMNLFLSKPIQLGVEFLLDLESESNWIALYLNANGTLISNRVG
jgi:hypothetical protein